MKYVALLTGKGEGCDYTIGCNKSFEVFESPDHISAEKKCKELWEAHGGAVDGGRIERIELYAVSETINVPVSAWNTLGAEAIAREQAETELARAEKRAQELRVKLGKT